MSDRSIRANGLGKRYRIGQRQGCRTLRDTISELAASPFRRLLGRRSAIGSSVSDTTIWALRDVSFEVSRGEVVGIIGGNGAGKSTLLKILSRITEPTTGEVEIRGRVGSLLEVGTGFHPELTGRENIFLNGAILGMKRAEIVRKFDDILAFAEVEPFIDTPVKSYSSGMYLRLAFAVAAHLEPEILIVDEVLAVGDAAFQKKCLGKMEDVARQGRTVLVVSHHMATLTHLCQSSLVLHNGSLEFQGSIMDGVDHYYRRIQPSHGAHVESPHVLYSRPAAEQVGTDGDEAFITGVEFLDEDGDPMPAVQTWDPLTIRIHFRVIKPSRNLHVLVQIATLYGTKIAVLTTSTHQQSCGHAATAAFADCRIPRFPLAAGSYLLGAGLCVPDQALIGFREDLAAFTVHPTDVFNCGRAPAAPDGLIAFEHSWTVGRNACT
jgi:lipopolysaccharide transport system ATP-binding protein